MKLTHSSDSTETNRDKSTCVNNHYSFRHTENRLLQNLVNESLCGSMFWLWRRSLFLSLTDFNFLLLFVFAAPLMCCSAHMACCLVLIPCCQVVGEADCEEHPSV